MYQTQARHYVNHVHETEQQIIKDCKDILLSHGKFAIQ